MPKVAVASTDGISINEHFGRSKEFLIYEVDDKGAYTLLERRASKPRCGHDANAHATAYAVQLLADVEVVLVSQIGPPAEQELRHSGIIAFQVTGPIGKALQAYGKRGKFIR